MVCLLFDNLKEVYKDHQKNLRSKLLNWPYFQCFQKAKEISFKKKNQLKIIIDNR